MPITKIKVNDAEQVWKSPDGKITIFKLSVEIDGKTGTLKTYSGKIAQAGFEGEVEVYEKEGKNGAEAFVKLPQRQGYGGGGSPRQAERSDYTMYLSYAKDLAVALIAQGKDLDGLAEAVETVALAGEQLYAKRPDAPKEEKAEDKPADSVEGEPIDLSEIPF